MSKESGVSREQIRLFFHNDFTGKSKKVSG